MVRTSLLLGACALFGSTLAAAVPSAQPATLEKKCGCPKDHKPSTDKPSEDNKAGIPPTPEFAKLDEQYKQNTIKSLKGRAESTCTDKNIAIRRSWYVRLSFSNR